MDSDDRSDAKVSGRLTIGQCATLACLLELAAPKPGNVHRGADFEDLTFTDFAVSAVALAPAMDAAAAGMRVGQCVLCAIEATRRSVPTNTNLGIVLLLAPLAAADPSLSFSDGLAQVLMRLSPEDARDVYQAIRLAQPGGLGQVEQMDVAGESPDDLLIAMRAAAGRDLVAQQYTNGFAQVLGHVVPSLEFGERAGWSTTESIVYAHVRLLSDFADSLIARKCGSATARQASERAAAVLRAGEPGGAMYLDALASFDFWLRSDHQLRNPGTTADLVTAGIFAALRDGILQPRFR